MRLRKIQVVVITIACLFAMGPAQAQFGKLKSLAKEKLGMQPKEDQKPAVNAEDLKKGPAGEAKATFAPGVKKSLDVSRQSGGTPEANVAPVNSGGSQVVSSGRSQVVSIKVSNMDARRFDAVRGYSPCNKLTGFQILSATQMKVTMDLTGSKSTGLCSLYFRSDGNTVFTSSVSIKGK